METEEPDQEPLMVPEEQEIFRSAAETRSEFWHLSPASSAAPAVRGNEVEEEEDAEPPAADPEQMSALELLRQAKEDHATKYASQSKRSRYKITPSARVSELTLLQVWR